MYMDTHLCHTILYMVTKNLSLYAKANMLYLEIVAVFHMDVSFTMNMVSLVPRPLFSVFICGGGKKGLVDLRRTFCSTDSQILGVVNRC